MLGEGLLGEAEVDPARFAALGDFAAERHLYRRMARPGPDRAEEVASLGGLLLGLESGPRARRILEHLLLAERFFDIYPLEVMAAVVEAAPGYLPGVVVEPVVQNKRYLETRMFRVEELISLELPLSAQVRAFAIEGGAAPGYCLSPGPPGRYHLEVAEEGRLSILLGARVRGVDRLERVRLWLDGGPDSASEW